MKKNEKRKLWKQGLGTALVCGLAVAVFPAAKADAADLLKAGPINTTAEHVTQNQPFAERTAGSQYFRIPAFIVTQKGNLLAAADARYSTTGDGGGLDTIASVSTDNGKTWNYSFPLYFPDSDGYIGNTATTIIDPALVQGKDGEIYCIADVNPTGVTTMGGYKAPGEGTGYVKVNGKDYLAVTDNYDNVNTQPKDDDATTYAYYVGDWDENGYAKILKRSDHSETGYGVDKWYNLYKVENGEYKDTLTQKQVNSNTDIQQNIFYKGSALHVYNTGYMMYAKTYDDGFTWTDPEILNPQIKRPTKETALLVSPGQGVLTSDGTIVIPFYDHGDGEENASIIWSDDNGKTWERSNDVPGAAAGGYWSSESEVVELSDGTLRMFFRSGQGVVCYSDAVRNTSGDYVFTKPVKTGVSCTSTCNVTAISYSKTIDGKQAILVAAPGGSGRANGKIFTFLVEEDKTLTLKNSYSVNSGTYQYSCMSELKNGTVGLLWENGGGSIRYDNYDIAQLAADGYINDLELGVELTRNETYTRSYQVAEEHKTGITTEADQKIADVNYAKVDGVEKEVVPMYAHIANNNSDLSSFAAKNDISLNLTDAEFTFTSTGTANVYAVYNENKKVYLTNESGANSFFSAAAKNNMLVTPTDGSDTFRICKENGERYVIFYYTNMDFNANRLYNASFTAGTYEVVLLEKKDKAEAGDIVPGYQRVSKVTSGKKYLIANIFNKDNKDHVIVLYPTNGTGNQTKLLGAAEKRITPTEATVTIKANEIGRTTTVIDGVTYNIVCDEPAAVNDKATLSTDAQVAERTYLEKDYPEGTFAKSGIAEAIAKAKEVAQKEKVTKLEIKEADDALKKALGKLDEVKASGKTEVQTKIAQAAEKKEADYTKESWANFAKAKRDAEMAFASETATAKQLKDAADALDIAMKALEAKKPDNNNDNNNGNNGNNNSQTPAIGSVIADASGIFNYKVTGNDTVEVKNMTAKGKAKSSVKIAKNIKANGKTYKVTAIAANALKGNKKVTSVSIGSNVEKIGKKAFANCMKLKTVTVNGNKLKTIGQSAFSGDKNLKAVNLKKVKTLKTVGKSAFKGVSKKVTVRVPKNKKAAYARIFKKGGIAASKIK
jgi:hypothetical protein